MGLHPDIVGLAEDVAKEAWSHLRADSKQWTEATSERLHREGFGESEDCLGRISKLHSPRHDDTFTSLELMEGFFRSIAWELSERGCRFYASVWDYQPKVPKEKWETQKKRSSHSKTVAYPSDTRAVDEGVLLPGAEYPELLNLRRFQASRAVKEQMWEFFKNNAHRACYFRSNPLPPGATLVLDYKDDGPWVFTVDKELGGFGRPVHRPDFGHDLREGDVSAWDYIVRDLAGRNAVLRTIDSDAIAIANFRLGCRKKDNALVLWRTDRGKHKDVLVDLKALVPAIRSGLKMTAVSFAFFCCLNGSDYCAKELSTHWIGVRYSKAAVQHYSTEITEVWGRLVDPSEEKHKAERLENLKKVLYRIYWIESPDLHDLFKKHGVSTLFNAPKNWDELYEKARPVLLAEKERLKDDEKKAAEATSKPKKKRKRGKDEVQEDEPKPKPKRKQTKKELKPPDPSMLDLLVYRIGFTIDYWRGWHSLADRKLYFPKSSSAGAGSSSSSSSSMVS